MSIAINSFNLGNIPRLNLGNVGGNSTSDALSVSSVSNTTPSGGVSLDFSSAYKTDAPQPDDMTSVFVTLAANLQKGSSNDFFVDTTKGDLPKPGSNVNSVAGMSGLIPPKSVDTMCW